MTNVESTLSPGENIIARAKLSASALIIPLIVTIVGAVGLFVDLGPSLNQVKPLALLLFIVGVLTTLPALANLFSTQLVLTDQRLVAESGLIRANKLDLRLDKLDRIEVKRPLLGKVLNYGTLVVTGRGVNRKPIPLIVSPDEMRLQIRAQRDNRGSNGAA
ncbi:MAG: PH domain-containing protein [Chloroflexi bacterium]|nr:PH domain-containing protein [Chloroflexota bacterium]